MLAVAVLGASGDGTGTAAAVSANKAPRITSVDARIGRVYEEGGGSRDDGLVLRFTLCDDGPQNVSGRRFARIRLTHRWGSPRAELLRVREQQPLIADDVHFVPRECVTGIAWSSVVPSDRRSARRYRWYAVTLRVRDPAGRWSNAVTRVLRGCVPGER